MIHTDWTKKAMKRPMKPTTGRWTRVEMPWRFHPFHLAEQMDDEISTVAALLHDGGGHRLDVGGAGGGRISGGVHEVLRLLTHPKEGALYGTTSPGSSTTLSR